MDKLIGRYIHIKGIVQGVGFRPFVYKIAQQNQLTGWVKNTSAGVEIIVNGSEDGVLAFLNTLEKNPPPLSQIDLIEIQSVEPDHFTDFKIIPSEEIQSGFIPISPDISICDDCLQELFDPKDRRYLYPFVNCTNCGPRFTIIEDIPYDRPNTTMSAFPMCESCSAEYNNPLDRRFHAQPVACPNCGPHIWIEDIHTGVYNDYSTDLNVLQQCQIWIKEGKILAIKGIGGFHLACDALNPAAVEKLRERKNRVDKPFAVMMPDIDTIMRHCVLNQADIDLLVSKERPIVILPRKKNSTIAEGVAPNQNTIGVMLPYTPLHYLLLSDINSTLVGFKPLLEAIVLTSGNISEEPIATDNSQALQTLSNIADAFLMHDRPIYIRCDDSVIRNIKTEDQRIIQMPIRRSRGYSPNPIRLPWKIPEILATGAELKNTFCLSKENYAFISHHIGDLQNYETFQSLEEGIKHFERIFRIKPQAIAYDMHPDYLSTYYALERAKDSQVPLIPIQHHHAHIASCLADNNIQDLQNVIGVAFDGTGYGDDGAIWGGEFLIASYTSYSRAAHLDYFPLPGGDASIRHPGRIALAYLYNASLQEDVDFTYVLPSLCADEKRMIKSQLEHKINLVKTSSMGRLFDIVAALAGVRSVVNYEAQAAIELEEMADPSVAEIYPYEIAYPETKYPETKTTPLKINTIPIISGVLADVQLQEQLPKISAKFHNTLADIVRSVCVTLRNMYHLNLVVLSGGVWQNVTLLRKTLQALNAEQFTVLVQSQVPPNDGGISLGQLVIAAHRIINER